VGEPSAWERVEDLDDETIADLRTGLRRELADRLRRDHGVASFDPDALTIGFARRFATYKRAALLLREPERLQALLGDDARPVQFVFAGKAHPADLPGQALLRAVAAFGSRPEARGRFLFVPGYDMALAGSLYAGCDVWLNTPVRPMEACGTSGEKAALNGGINCSVEDGWWAEWCDDRNGWSIPTCDEADPEWRDGREAAALFDLLESSVVPTFHAEPADWIERIRFGWSHLGPRVTAGRMVAEYRDRLYAPAMGRS
jgi:starch phosphorylase